MSNTWSLFVIIGTVLTVIATFWLIVWSGRQGPEPSETVHDTGHSWDGLTERNEPLPRWWLGLFVITLIFGVAYLVIFPGFGSYDGVARWSQHGQYDAEIDAAEATYGPLFAAFRDLAPEALVHNEEALAMGASLFSNYCTQCHGSLGYGAAGFPNLTDTDWLYGDDFASIETSILNGRAGVMPALGPALGGDAGVDAMVDYVRNMATGVDTTSPAHAQYTALCSACHGAKGDGNPLLGAPRLNDDVWLYGSSPAVVRDTIVNGRQGQMPGHRNFLGEDRVRVLAAYVYRLSRPEADREDGD